jgi:glutamate dehydrogenase (NAD(P)+)
MRLLCEISIQLNGNPLYLTWNVQLTGLTGCLSFYRNWRLPEQRGFLCGGLTVPAPFDIADELGPFQTIYINEPSVHLRAIVVVDNVAAGPSIGGVRLATDVSFEECARLARAMTLKNTAAELPHGGGKSVIFADSHADRGRKEQLIRAFANAIGDLEDYIVGPDMGSDEQCMAWVHDEIGRAVGLPREIGGIPLDEIGITGWGVARAAEVGVEFRDFELDGAKIAVQGFGAVGYHAARFLAEQGAILVAAADSTGSIYNPQGLNVEELAELKDGGGSVTDYSSGEVGDSADVIDVDCDIWIPAARPDVLDENNVDRLQANMVIQGANIPVTDAAEHKLFERGVVNIPDFIANSGGVIFAAMEYRGSSESEVFDVVEETISRNTHQTLELSRSEEMLPREAAEQLAESRVRSAMNNRRWSLQSGGQ